MKLTPNATVVFVDKDEGYFLKSAKAGMIAPRRSILSSLKGYAT